MSSTRLIDRGLRSAGSGAGRGQAGDTGRGEGVGDAIFMRVPGGASGPGSSARQRPGRHPPPGWRAVDHDCSPQRASSPAGHPAGQGGDAPAVRLAGPRAASPARSRSRLSPLEKLMVCRPAFTGRLGRVCGEAARTVDLWIRGRGPRCLDYCARIVQRCAVRPLASEKGEIRNSCIVRHARQGSALAQGLGSAGPSSVVRGRPPWQIFDSEFSPRRNWAS